MGKRHPNHRLVKIHRNYTVEDIANLFGIHKNTVRNWVKDGLATIDEKRPMLILARSWWHLLRSAGQKTSRAANRGNSIAFGAVFRNFPRATWRNIHLSQRSLVT
jgi:uncharacterized protein YjcR